MNGRLVRKVNTRAQVLSTEIDFGLALVKVCCIERSFGDSARAARALSEARNIHMTMAAVIGPAKKDPALRRKFGKLANLLRQVNQLAPDLGESLAATSRPVPSVGMEPRVM